MRDNTLVAALGNAGHEALLVPTYTPIRTDEEDVSQGRVFFGGINVYLEQKFWLFRHTPRFLDRLFNFRWLVRWVSRFAQRTKYSELGDLTISMLQGTHGNQLKEVTKLADWLETEVRPEVVVLTNALLSGVAPELRRRLGVPIVVTFQGDDIFLDALPAADRERCFALIRENCAGAAAFVTTSRAYAEHMAGYLGLPREKMHAVHPGLNLNGHGGPRPVTRDHPLTIGYFARICPEKGFHNLVDAYIHLRRRPGSPPTRLRASGWLGENNRAFFGAQVKKLEAAGLLAEFEYVESPGHDEKVKFLRSVDVFSVPTTYREPKGLYVLEAWANGVPVVQPCHGSFPELVEATGGGLLVEPENPAALAAGLRQMLDDHELRDRCGRAGEAAVRERFTAATMADATAALLDRIVKDTR
ncbi:glycosyltransferase family 4 protein [Gemmata sp.]|uniref:glycosyltransferase family 4 protein n=1 Tax=Gemmata sp. TaxID=1914242 RepID=UPI003F72F672